MFSVFPQPSTTGMCDIGSQIIQYSFIQGRLLSTHEVPGTVVRREAAARNKGNENLVNITSHWRRHVVYKEKKIKRMK